MISESWTISLQTRTRRHHVLMAWRSGNSTVARSMCQPNQRFTLYYPLVHPLRPRTRDTSTSPPTNICIDCVMEDLGAILREEDGENGETRDRKWDELSGKMVSKETSIPRHLMTTEGTTKGVDDTYVIREGQKSMEVVYEGPYRVIHSRVKYQNLARAPYCKHFQKAKNSIHPLTTKVQVTAKLSRQHDSHLPREAENYQRFPKHFFEHWSGYNLLPPLDDPTPVGALVPQFYGYYVPKQEVSAGNCTARPYLSPILLIEHCGKPIQEVQSIDDK